MSGKEFRFWYKSIKIIEILKPNIIFNIIWPEIKSIWNKNNWSKYKIYPIFPKKTKNKYKFTNDNIKTKAWRLLKVILTS
jgi:hypothetical protein